MGHRLFMLALFAGIPAAAATCESLATLARANTTITTAESVTSGSFKPPTGPALEKLPAFCRVAGVIKPSSDSEILFEVWMPSSAWNGKFYGVGNGGFAGLITFPGLASALRRGFATASTDTGHAAGGPMPSGRWDITRRWWTSDIARYMKRPRPPRQLSRRFTETDRRSHISARVRMEDAKR